MKNRAFLVLDNTFAPALAGGVFAKLARRLAEDPFEHAIKLRERLRIDFVSNFADAAIRIGEFYARLFRSRARATAIKAAPGDPVSGNSLSSNSFP